MLVQRVEQRAVGLGRRSVDRLTRQGHRLAGDGAARPRRPHLGSEEALTMAEYIQHIAHECGAEARQLVTPG